MPSKRAYRLTTQGLAALRESARRNRPWESSSGPRTLAGKAVSSLNATKHGQRGREAREARAFLNWVIDGRGSDDPQADSERWLAYVRREVDFSGERRGARRGSLAVD